MPREPCSAVRLECAWLEENFVKCVKEKALQDNVEMMECKVENVKINFLVKALREP